VEHRLDVRRAKPPLNVLPQRAELARGDLIAAPEAFLDQKLTHVGSEGLGDVWRQVKRFGALEDHAVIHAMDVPAIAGVGDASEEPRAKRPAVCAAEMASTPILGRSAPFFLKKTGERAHFPLQGDGGNDRPHALVSFLQVTVSSEYLQFAVVPCCELV
jgi:hypothetical protein